MNQQSNNLNLIKALDQTTRIQELRGRQEQAKCHPKGQPANPECRTFHSTNDLVWFSNKSMAQETQSRE